MIQTPLSILHITTDANLGGAEQMLIWMAKYIDRTRYRLLFCTISKSGPLNEVLAQMGFEVFSLEVEGVCSIPGAIWRFKKILGCVQPHLIHSHLLLGGLFAALCVKSKTHLHHRHYGNFFRGLGTWLNKILDCFVVHAADQIIAVSLAVKMDLTQRLKIAEQKVGVLENAIDLELFDPDKVHSVANAVVKNAIREGHRPLIGMVANFHPGKGHLVLLKSIKNLLGTFPNLLVLFFGEGSGEALVKKQVEDLSVNPQVQFCGFEKDIASVISKFDVLVVPSLSEGFGLVACEAMALGVPVVASRLEGLANIIVHEQTGLLFEGGNSEALGLALARVLSDQNLRGKMVNQARAITQERFSIKKYVVALQKIYDQSVGKSQ